MIPKACPEVFCDGLRLHRIPFDEENYQRVAIITKKWLEEYAGILLNQSLDYSDLRTNTISVLNDKGIGDDIMERIKKRWPATAKNFCTPDPLKEAGP